MSVTNSTESETHRKLRLPPVWLLGCVAVILMFAAAYWSIANPWNQKLEVIKAIEELQGFCEHQQTGPDWMRAIFGHPSIISSEKIGPYDQIFRVDLSRQDFRNAGDAKWDLTRGLISRLRILPDIDSLDISYSTATDDWIPVICQHKSLTTIDLSHCRISGRGFGRLRELPHLKQLDFRYCPLRDKYLKHLAAVPSLRFANFAYCSYLSADGIDELLQAKPELEVYLLGLSDVHSALRDRGYEIDEFGLAAPQLGNSILK